MKTGILLFLVCCGAITAKGQSFIMSDDFLYATVKDTDGFVNVRESPGSTAKIKGKIDNYTVFNCEQTGTNWWKVEQINEDNWLDGYVYKDRIILLKWEKINKKNRYTDSAIFKQDSLTIIVHSKLFYPKKHKLSYYKDAKGELEKIDGIRIWGTDGNIPKKAISSVKIIKNTKTFLLPRAAFDDLYEPKLANLSICTGPENTLYLRMDNSDGAGYYTVIWIFKDNKYKGRYIDDSLA